MGERSSVFTPEGLAEWLVDRQRHFYGRLLDALQDPSEELRPLEFSSEGLVELSCHAYLAQLTVVCVTFEQLLDDTRFLNGNKPNSTIPLTEFVTRIHRAANKLVEHEFRIRDGKFGGDPFRVAPICIEIEKLFPDLLLYYGSCFCDWDGYAPLRQDVVGFAKQMVDEIGATDNPIARAASLAYYNAHKALLPKSLVFDRFNPSDAALAVLLRSWKPWCLYLFSLNEELIAHLGSRVPDFGAGPTQ
jgi:hypothetical protein